MTRCAMGVIGVICPYQIAATMKICIVCKTQLQITDNRHGQTDWVSDAKKFDRLCSHFRPCHKREFSSVALCSLATRS